VRARIDRISAAAQSAFRREWRLWLLAAALIGFFIVDILLPAATASTVAAAIAALAAVVALIYARSILREAGATTAAQHDTLHATKALTGRIETSIDKLEQILAETQAMRELEQLTRVAEQVAMVIALIRRVRAAAFGGREQPPPNWELGEQQRLLATLIAGLPVARLPRCLEIANDVGATSAPEGAHIQATEELKAAMAAARQRLAGASAGSVEP
jgi:hypothetical protein